MENESSEEKGKTERDAADGPRHSNAAVTGTSATASVGNVGAASLSQDDAPPNPSDREAFQQWLETKPREWSVVIAARAALRVLPLARTAKFGSPEILLPVFRATAIARFAAAYPKRTIEVAAAYAAVRAAADARVPVAEAAAYAAYAAPRAAADAAARAAEAAAHVIAADRAHYTAADDAVRQDALDLQGGTPPNRLAHTALWPATGVLATEIRETWGHLAHSLRLFDRSWEVWIDWFENVLAGFPMSPRLSAADNEALEAAFTDVKDPSHPWQGPLPWDQGAKAVNLAIKARLDALQSLSSPPFAESAAVGLDTLKESDPLPLEGVASPVTIVRRADGRIAIDAGAFAVPELPPSLTPEDFLRTLAACRSLAERLRATAAAPTFQGRPDYAEAFAAYLEWLPTDAGGGNILLADGEARVLNKLFTADEGILATTFAARLSVFLETHIGLRAHYDEVERLYQAVRTGRLEAPLQRDAVEGIKRAVHDNTPAVFDESVPPVVDETAKPVPEPPPLAPEDRPPPDPNRPKPPRDPIADVDPKKSRNYLFATTANRIWEILLKGKDVPTAIEGWHKTYDQMKPHIGPIIDWLRVFTGG